MIDGNAVAEERLSGGFGSLRAESLALKVMACALRARLLGDSPEAEPEYRAAQPSGCGGRVEDWLLQQAIVSADLANTRAAIADLCKQFPTPPKGE